MTRRREDEMVGPPTGQRMGVESPRTEGLVADVNGAGFGSEMAEPILEVKNLRKRFQRSDGTVVNAVDDISVSVAPGELVVLLGPSGCGKTTLLRSVAGLEIPDSGRVIVDGQVVFDSENRVALSPEHRNASMVFQSYALWPHMSVFANVAYPLKTQRPRLARAEIKDQVHLALQQVGISELADQYPNQISGGQQQRVALARAIVKNDKLILFDEPLSNVDAKVRDQLRYELLTMQDRLGFAALYVTHDQTEALQLADRIAVLGTGSVQQLGSPSEIYRQPASPYVASFVGSANILQGKVASRDGAEIDVTTELGAVVGQYSGAAELLVGDEVLVMWRPERAVTCSVAAAVNCWWASLVRTTFLGSYVEDLYDVGGVSLSVWRSDGSVTDAQEGWLRVDPKHVRILARN